MTIRIEHANLAVRDVDEMIRFLTTAFPEFAIRREGKTWQGWRWVHLGTAETYIAINEAPEEPAEAWVPYAGRPGLNHLGYEVDDAESLRRRLTRAGYRDGPQRVAAGKAKRGRVQVRDDRAAAEDEAAELEAAEAEAEAAEQAAR